MFLRPLRKSGWRNKTLGRSAVAGPAIRVLRTGVAARTPQGRLTAALGQGQRDAREANLQRYRDILALYKKRQQAVMAESQQLGAQERVDILTRGSQRQATIGQDLVSRGVTGTTAGIAPRMAGARVTESALGGLSDRLRQQRVGLLERLPLPQLQFMERREDEYPDIASMLPLLQQSGYAGAAIRPKRRRLRSQRSPIQRRLMARRRRR